MSELYPAFEYPVGFKINEELVADLANKKITAAYWNGLWGVVIKQGNHFDQTFLSMEATLVQYKADITAIHDAAQPNITALETLTAAHTTRLTGIDNYLGGQIMGAGWGDLWTHITSVEENIPTISADITALKTLTAGHTAGIAAAGVEMNNQFLDVFGRLVTIETYKNNLDVLTIPVIQQDVTALETLTATHTGNITSINASVDALKIVPLTGNINPNTCFAANTYVITGTINSPGATETGGGIWKLEVSRNDIQYPSIITQKVDSGSGVLKRVVAEDLSSDTGFVYQREVNSLPIFVYETSQNIDGAAFQVAGTIHVLKSGWTSSYWDGNNWITDSSLSASILFVTRIDTEGMSSNSQQELLCGSYHRIRIFYTDDSMWYGWNYIDLTTLTSTINAKANTYQGGWLAPTLLNGAVTDATDPIKYRKNQFGKVEFKGKFTSVTFDSPSFEMPIGYRRVTTGNARFVVPNDATYNFVAVMSSNVFGTIGLLDFSSVSYYAEA